nr:MAG TPA: hypothetical protein [Caudoviricetes sp.]
MLYVYNLTAQKRLTVRPQLFQCNSGCRTRCSKRVKRCGTLLPCLTYDFKAVQFRLAALNRSS